MSQVYGRFPRNGRTADAMAKKVGVSVRTAQRWTSEPREVYLARARQRAEKIRALRAKGLTMREIAEAVGVSVGTVHRAIHLTDR